MPTADSWGGGRFSSSTCRAETVPACQELGEKSLLWCGQGEGQLSRNCISTSSPESEAITTLHRISPKDGSEKGTVDRRWTNGKDRETW